MITHQPNTPEKRHEFVLSPEAQLRVQTLQAALQKMRSLEPNILRLPRASVTKGADSPEIRDAVAVDELIRELEADEPARGSFKPAHGSDAPKATVPVASILAPLNIDQIRANIEREAK